MVVTRGDTGVSVLQYQVEFPRGRTFNRIPGNLIVHPHSLHLIPTPNETPLRWHGRKKTER